MCYFHQYTDLPLQINHIFLKSADVLRNFCEVLVEIDIFILFWNICNDIAFNGTLPIKKVILYGNRTIPPSPLDNYPLDNCHLVQLTPGQSPPDNSHLWQLPPYRTIPIRVIASRRLCRPKIFCCLSFCLSHNKILYKHKHAFFQNILADSLLG